MMTLLNTLFIKQTGIDLNIWIPFLIDKGITYGPYISAQIGNVMGVTAPYVGYTVYTALALTGGLKISEYLYNYKYFYNKTIENTPYVNQVAWVANKVSVLAGTSPTKTTPVEYYPLFNKVMTFLHINELFNKKNVVIYKDREIIRYKHREDILSLKKEFDKLQDSVTNLQLIDRGIIDGKQTYIKEIEKLRVLEELRPETINDTIWGSAVYIPENSKVPSNHKIKKMVFAGEFYLSRIGGQLELGLEVYYEVPALFGVASENKIIVYSSWFDSQYENLSKILKDNPNFEFYIVHKAVSTLGLKGHRFIIDAENSFLLDPKNGSSVKILDYLTEKGLTQSAHAQYRVGEKMEKLEKTLAKSLTYKTQDMSNIVYNQVASKLGPRDITSLKIATQNGKKDFNAVLNPFVAGALTISGTVAKLAILLQGTPVLENLDAINSLIQICPYLDVDVPDIFVKAKTLVLDKISQAPIQTPISSNTDITTNISSISSTMSSYVSSNAPSWKTLAIGVGILGGAASIYYCAKYLGGNTSVINDAISATQPSEYSQSFKKYLEII